MLFKMWYKQTSIRYATSAQHFTQMRLVRVQHTIFYNATEPRISYNQINYNIVYNYINYNRVSYICIKCRFTNKITTYSNPYLGANKLYPLCNVGTTLHTDAARARTTHHFL